MFETKKIQSETLGEYLKAVRATFDLSLEEVSHRTEVNARLLSALENGKMQILPADVYVFGALRHLAKFYQLDDQDLIDQYKKERQISKQLIGHKVSAVMKLSNFWKNFVFTPKVLVLITTSFFVLFTLIYLFWQVSYINRTPQLSIFEPTDQQIITSLSAKISGQTDPGINVHINGQEVFVDNQGRFMTEISLAPGPAEIKILAKNRFGKEINKNLKVFAQNSGDENKPAGVLLKLVFTGVVQLSYTSDDKPAINKELKSGDTLQIEAKEKIMVSVSNGGLVSGELNGQALGLLGKKGEVIKDLSFTK